MAKDDRIILLLGDLGFSLFEPIQRDYPDRCFNMQAAEFAGVGAAIGMALSGKIPIYYTITPFGICRPFELLRTYVSHERIPIKLACAGRDSDYKTEGWSHHAHDAKQILDCLPNIEQFWPKDEAELAASMDAFLFNDKPCFLSLSK